MAEPVTLGIVIVKLLGVTAHGAAAKGTAAVAGKGLIVHGTVAKGAAITAGHGLHLSLPVLLGAAIPTSTVAGVTFVKLYGNLLDDLYNEVKRQGRQMPTRFEAKRVLIVAYRQAKAQLEAKGFLTPRGLREMDEVYRNCLDRQLALAA